MTWLTSHSSCPYLLKNGNEGAAPSSPKLQPVGEADDESIAIRHPHLRQGLRVHGVVLAYDFVKRKNVRGQSINFIVGERPWLPPWHCAANIIEESCREGPEVGDGLLRLHVLNRIAANQPRVDATFAVFTMAHCTFCGEDAGSVSGVTAAVRKARTVWQNVDIPLRNLGRIERLSKIGRLSEGRACTKSDREHDDICCELMRIHASLPRCARPTKS